MNSIFKEKDLIVCDVPVPKGYLQSQTHSGVAVHDGQVFLCTSPFPEVKRNRIQGHIRGLLLRISNGEFPKKHGDNDENPMLYWGKSGEIAPIRFEPFIGNPVVSIPPSLFGYPSFNSDPDIFIEGDNLYLINREFIRKTQPRSKHFVGDSLIRLDMVRFVIRDNCPHYIGSSIFLESESNIISPCLAKIGNQYRLFYLNTFSYLYPESDSKLYMLLDNQINGSYKDRQEILIDGGNYVPWHLSVFSFDDKLYAIVACIRKGTPKRLYQMLGEFNTDLTKLTIYQTPLINIPSYRGAAYVTSEGEFIIYSTTDCYRLPGSKSVDGKDVAMSRISFAQLLEILSHK